MKKDSISYLALGDSYTIGESVAEQGRYPVLLAKELKKNNYEVTKSTIIATTGWTTDDLTDGMNAMLEQGAQYDLVSLLIGVNNQFQGKSIEDYKVQFTSLLLRSIEIARGSKKRVFVVSIPDYGFTPYGASSKDFISAEVDRFNQVNKQVSDSLGVRYFDITPVSRLGLSNPSLVASDGLHPSEMMYQQWVELMLSGILEMLELK